MPQEQNTYVGIATFGIILSKCNANEEEIRRMPTKVVEVTDIFTVN